MRLPFHICVQSVFWSNVLNPNDNQVCIIATIIQSSVDNTGRPSVAPYSDNNFLLWYACVLRVQILNFSLWNLHK